jgi:hypothetical protein
MISIAQIASILERVAAGSDEQHRIMLRGAFQVALFELEIAQQLAESNKLRPLVEYLRRPRTLEEIIIFDYFHGGNRLVERLLDAGARVEFFRDSRGAVFQVLKK